MTTRRTGRLAVGSVPIEEEMDAAAAAASYARLEQFSADCRLLDTKRAELAREVGENGYVAAFEGVIYHAPSWTDLVASLRANGVEPGHAAVRLLTLRSRIAAHAW